MDDLGTGNYLDSNTTGHAGPRMGCCIIKSDDTSRAAPVCASLAVVFYVLVIAASFLLPSSLGLTLAQP